jgi:phage-related protein
MKIETKFGCGDVVWFINGAYIVDLKITKIEITISSNKLRIYYSGHNERGINFSEVQDNLFSSKDECALIWLKNQGLEVGIK